MIKKIVFAFVMVMVLAGSSWPYTGSGSSSNPFVISSYSDFRTLMQSNYATSGSYFKLSCDIQLAGYSNWEPKGTIDTPFTGHFDGQGHRIYINLQPLPLTLGNYADLAEDRSLFGVLGSGGEILSLDVEGTVRGYNAGGLVSILDGGTIRNCSFSGDVIVETSPEGSEAMNYLIDELADDNITDANGVEILDNVTYKTRVYGKINAGGLAAVMLGGNIEDSSFRGNVTATADQTPASSGGIVGRMIEDSESISGCYVEGDAVITASTSANGYGVLAMAGGIAGYANTQLESSIESCTFDGVVNSTYYAGGIAGSVRGTILSDDLVTSTARVTGTYSAGGIAGYMASGAWATGNSVESGAVITAETYSSGGIIGLLETSGRTGTHKAVENNTSYATISGDVYQGGIVGALGNNTSSGAAIDTTTNTCSSEYHLIGRDEWGNPSDGGTSYSISTTAFTWTAGEENTITLTVNGLSDSTAATWSFSGLPDGLTADTSGKITGTLTTAGTYAFTATATISGYGDISAAITITVTSEDTSGFYIATGSVPSGTQDTYYSAAISAGGYTDYDSISWSLVSGTLPSGLSFGNAAGVGSYAISDDRGLLYGTPTVSGYFTFTVQAVLALGSASYSATYAYTLYIAPSKVVISTDELPDASLRRYYSAEIEADISSVWTLSDGTLPDGLSLSTVDGKGRISGTPSESGSFTFTVTAAASELTGTKTFTLVVNDADFTITTGSLLKPGIAGEAYTETLSHDAGTSTSSAVWYMYSGTLPTGLSLSRTAGTISGTPTTAGTYTFRIGLMIGDQITSKSFTIVIISAADYADFTITTDALIPAIRGTAYSFTLSTDASASLGTPVWYIDSGSLPSGLSLSSGGVISGTPTTAGSYTFTVGLFVGNQILTKSFTLVVIPAAVSSDFTITTDALKPAIRGTYYSQTLSTDASASLGTPMWYIDSGSLPSGLSLSSGGVISGTPTTAGSYTITISVLAGNYTAAKTFTLIVIPTAVSSDYSITTSSLKPGIAGTSYAQTLSSDIPASYTPRFWYIDTGSLPEGLSLSRTTGVISGTPAASGTYTFTVGLFARDQIITKSFTITIIPGTSITTETLPPGTEGKSYSQTLTSDSSASGTRIWYIDTGELPPGLTLARNTGIISGTPTQAGTYSFRVRLLIGDHITAKTFTLFIIPGLSISGNNIPDGKEGSPYSYTFTASADSAVWTHTAGTLPTGLTLSSGGILSGTPTRAGTYSFTIRAELSSESLKAERTFSLTIRPVFSILNAAALPRAKVNTWYSETLSADAESSYMVSWKLLDGSLPSGLYLNSSTGNISGTPQAEGSYTFTIQASAGSYISAKRFTLIVGPALEILTEAQLPSWKLNKYYSMLFTTDSTFPVFWTLSGGSIPAGLYFADGVLDGTPTATGTYSFTLTAESGGMTASKTFTMTISPALSITTPEVLPSVKARAYYSYTLSTDADDPSTVLWSTTYSYTNNYNRLPGGMYIDETTGTIYGTPTAEGTYTFTVRAVMGSISTSKEFTLTVRPMLSITTKSPLPHAEVNERYSVTLLTDADENQTVTWSVAAGTLPDRLVLDAQTGELSGYPLNEGTYSFTIQAFSNGLTAQKRFELTAGENMSIIVPESDPVLEAGEYFEMALLTDKASSTSTSWTVIDGILPPGIDLNTATGVIAGTPSRAGRYTFTVRAESGYSVAEKQITLTVEFAILSEWLLPDGAVGQSYSYRFTAKGVSASSVLWTVSSDSVLPRGLSLATNGILSGTTNTAGTYTFMLYAFVSNDVSAMQTVRLKIAEDAKTAVPILTTSLPDGQVSQDYYAELRAGIEGVSWGLESGELPAGLTLREDGLISGVPTRAGMYVFIVRAYVSGRDSTRQLTITIDPVPETRYASGGGGGCDSGIGMIGLAVLGLMLRRHKH